MKKVILVTGAAVFALASFAAAYTFSANLTVGSTGADVVALQQALKASGQSIPSIASGAAQPGYFGSQTKAAVVAFQASKGLPATGFVGPLTRGVLNGSTVATTVSTACPVGFTCTANPGTTAPVTGTVVGISTTGVAGSLDIANGSIVGNGTSVNDGQEVDLGSISLQSGASDMAVSSIAVDFNVRPWLYMSSLSIKDQNGNVLATASNLNQGNFSEITVGTDYRISIPVSVVVPHATKIYAVLHGVFATSNRQATPIALVRLSVRSTDGTGVSLTSDTGLLGTTVMYVAYGGQQGSSIIVTTDPSSPVAGHVIQTSTGNTQTQNVLLGVFDLKSQNIQSTLQGLTANVSIAGQGSIGSTFAYFQLKSGSTVLNTGTPTTPNASSSAVTFSNFNLALLANQYTTVSLYATVNGGVTGVTASSSLVLTADVNGLSNQITGIDSSSNSLTLSNKNTTFTVPGGGNQTISLSGTSLSNLAWSINGGTPTSLVGTSPARYPSQVFYNGSFTVTAGNNPLYLSTNGATALTLATSSSAGASSDLTDAVTVFTPADGIQSWDSSGSYYQIPANATRTFNTTGVLALASTASTTQISASVGATAVNLGSAIGLSDLKVSTQLQGLNSDFSKGSVFLNGSL